MNLGEIVIENKLFENSLIKQISEKGIVSINDTFDFKNIPTLIIGWKNVNKTIKLKVSIVNKKVKKNIFWTFSPEEDLQDFNEDIIKFIDKLYEDFVSGIKYEFIDPIIKNIKNSTDIKNIVKEGKFDVSYFTDDFIYIYNESEKLIYGIDLNYYNFLKYNIKTLTNIITENSDNVFIEDYTLESGIYQKYKNFLNKDFDKKFLAYILYKENR